MTWFIWALLAALFWGFAPILARMGLVKAEPLAALFIRTSGVFFGLIFLNSIFHQWHSVKSIPLKSWLILLAEGLLASLFGHFAYFYALKLGRASLVVPITAAFPLVALFFAWLILGEQVSVLKLAGAFLIIGGIVLIKL